MNWDQFVGNWKQIMGKAKQKWGKLTGNDATAFAGKGDQLAGELQQKYGDSKQQAQNALRRISTRAHPRDRSQLSLQMPLGIAER